MTNQLDGLCLRLDGIPYIGGEANALDFTPSGEAIVPAGAHLRGAKLFGSYTLGAGAMFQGYATDITAEGPAGVNVYVATNVIHAKGAINAKPGYDCVVSEVDFTGVSVPTVTATHYRTGQAYAGAHQIRLKPLDETAILDSFRWIHNDGLPAKINTADDFGPALEAQSAFRRAFNGGPGALDQFYDLLGNLLWSVDRLGKFECCGGIIKGPVEFRSPAKFVNQQYAEFQNSAGRQFFLQAVLVGGVEYFRLLIGYVGEAVRFLVTGGVEIMGSVHANYAATPPAGGSPNVCLKVAGIGWYVGTGDPTLTAAVGSNYTDVSVPRDWTMTPTGWALA